MGKLLPVPMEKAVFIRTDIRGGHVRFHKTALFREKLPHGVDHVLHVQHGGAARIGGFSAAFPVFRPWEKGARIGAGLRGRLAFLPDFQLVLRFQFPENRGLLPPGAAQFPFRLRIKGLRCGQAFLLPPAGAEGPARQGIHQPGGHTGSCFRNRAVCDGEIRAAAFQFPCQAASGDSLADDKNVHDR